MGNMGIIPIRIIINSNKDNNKDKDNSYSSRIDIDIHPYFV